eukprot:7564780-Lingulodinium_polyedra.AAC.1
MSPAGAHERGRSQGWAHGGSFSRARHEPMNAGAVKGGLMAAAFREPGMSPRMRAQSKVGSVAGNRAPAAGFRPLG